jgi:hypothetical protein
MGIVQLMQLGASFPAGEVSEIIGLFTHLAVLKWRRLGGDDTWQYRELIIFSIENHYGTQSLATWLR